jgi:hypothetical protein
MSAPTRTASIASAGRSRPWPSGRTAELTPDAAELENLGHLNERGQPFNAKSIKSMLEQ